MMPDRWTLAIKDGKIKRPGRRVFVMGARADAVFDVFGDITCVQGFAPDYDRLIARGLNVVTEVDGRFDAALVQITKSKVGTLSAIAEALLHLDPGGLLMVDGQKEEGIESAAKRLKGQFDLEGVISKSHGKLVWMRRPRNLPQAVMDWIATPQEIKEGYLTIPGGFSANRPDRGSEILVALIPELRGRVADFGAGWGYISGEVLAEQDGIETLDIIEADHAMLTAAKLNIDDPRARFFWTDLNRYKTRAPYDCVLSNPPFHTGRRADPDLGRAFIHSAARNLAPKGRFFMVANRHLPYEDTLRAHFGTGRLMGELEGYKIYEASKPQQSSRI